MPQWQIEQPTHLSIFVTDPETGQPSTRLPLYAEVAVPRIVPPPPPETRFIEQMRAALQALDPSVKSAVRNAVEQAAQQALAETLDADSLDEIDAQDYQQTNELFYIIFKEVLFMAGRDRFAHIKPAELKELIIAVLRKVADQFGFNLLEVPEETGTIWADPLGVLTTDHVGFASFDLKRLRPEVRQMLSEAIELRRNDPAAVLKLAIWVQPYGHEKRYNALAQARFAFDAVVARLSIPLSVMPASLNNMGPRSLQNPSLTDWRLSPASFAASPKTLLGEDGCEELLPANLALQEFVLRQVVRLAEPPAGFTVPPDCKAAYVDDYKVSWYSLGHSLGEILYSLPLAPGETVKLAVIDWSWDNLTKRDEQTKLTEELLHQTHRDRTITEVVKAGLKEMQHGSSFMGGMATSAGATGSMDMGVAGVGGAVGNAWSLGGSTATSDGSRDLAAENVQRLSDSFSQASSAQREINSTVVIQARQEEQESIQTRTFTNYNHSHTLTILYYEVLRHYRVTVEWVRRRPALLMMLPAGITKFEDADLIGYRYLLEPALLDPTLKTAFDALEKREAIREYQTTNKITSPPPPGWEGDVDFEMFEIALWSKDGATPKTIVGYVITADHGINDKWLELHYVYKGTHIGSDYTPHNINSGERLNNEWQQWTALKPFKRGDDKYVSVKWSEIVGFQFEKWSDDEWRIDALTINAYSSDGFVAYLTDYRLEVDFYFADSQPSSQIFTGIKRPGPRPAPLPPVLTPEASITTEEGHQIKKLKDHFVRNIDYYNRIVLFGTDPMSVAIQLDEKTWNGKTYADIVESTPLEVFGRYVAYPLANRSQIDDTLAVDLAAGLNGNDPARRQWAADRLTQLSETDRQQMLERIALASAKSERLITLPTRGVFAEGKLGHCNISEEIDNTRFWKWEEHPIPFEAPGIDPITPIQPQPQQVAVAPTMFPQSLVNIVNPSPAPDPTGLAAAMNLLGTPNLFRDMSGRQEVADLLKKLSDNTIDIAEAANRAREIQAKSSSDLDRQQKDYDLGIYKAAAEVEGKSVEAEAQRAAQAQASKSEAEAKKANVDAATQQAEAAKNLPKPLRGPVYKDAAQSLAGNPTKNKAVVFKAVGYNGQTLEGVFGLAIRDVFGQKDVIAENKVGAYFDRTVSFSIPDPVIEARARRIGTAIIKIFDETITLPEIDIVPRKDSYTVGKSHKVINVTLTQSSRDVSFKAKSTNAAVDELMNKWGAELGVDKVVAAKLVASYEQKHQITHGTEEEKSYSFNVPTQNYELNITSK